MDPISVALLAALVGGVGGEAGRQAWADLSALVRRPFQRSGDTDAPGVGSGEVELAGLEEAPADQDRAQALSTVLAVRAALDADFSAGLQRWHEQAKLVRPGGSEVHSTISGQPVFHGPVLLGRDFPGLSITSSPPPPPATPGTDPPAQGRPA
ncbi:hypothetical protein [Streptomyces flaveus]|uniref:Uncharacterized protein n=1 Tax=Streptomyces flaveus TaxID=66370 RepID=A0A917RPL9_9ACTN|nr:hypothetical protein [Streptomyces flaveus]GGL18129.1 hypothetical protein GCM10010094_93850 [Streptomyces flaveus]